MPARHHHVVVRSAIAVTWNRHGSLRGGTCTQGWIWCACAHVVRSFALEPPPGCPRRPGSAGVPMSNAGWLALTTIPDTRRLMASSIAGRLATQFLLFFGSVCKGTRAHGSMAAGLCVALNTTGDNTARTTPQRRAPPPAYRHRHEFTLPQSPRAPCANPRAPRCCPFRDGQDIDCDQQGCDYLKHSPLAMSLWLTRGATVRLSRSIFGSALSPWAATCIASPVS